VIRDVLTSLVGMYRRWISPLMPGACRYEPSCSRYALLCLKYHGAARGSWMTAKRICRCNPLFGGGLDFPTLPDWAPAEEREPDWQRLSILLNPSSSSPFRDSGRQ
jgi:putative membrane protein insertion efficiency factor